MRRSRESRRLEFPGLSDEALDALAEFDERLGLYGPPLDSDAVGFMWPQR